MGNGMRTPSGGVSEAARAKYGAKKGSGLKPGAYPIFDHTSAMSAIKLRGHANDPGAVLSRAARWASAHNDEVVLAAVKKARAADRVKK